MAGAMDWLFFGNGWEYNFAPLPQTAIYKNKY